jgi:dTDP-glucose pyrophosphorylase
MIDSSKLKSISIRNKSTLAVALKQMDAQKRKLLIVIDEQDCFFSLISIGDIQRAIIRNMALETAITAIVRKSIIVARIGDDLGLLKEKMKQHRIEFMPVMDANNKVVNVIFWEDLFKEGDDIGPSFHFNLPVVIMAGGIGSRLRPFTNVLPKPLFPIGEKTVVEHIFDRFRAHGCNSFHVSVNYKAELIEFYLQQQNLPYSVSFFREEKPLGTAGSLSMLKGLINDTFFVSNCDILIDQDYSEVLQYHRQNKNEITVVAAIKHFPIAYGTIETGENGKLLCLTEKPELTFKINSGMYIIEPHLLEEIPENTFHHITQLIDLVTKRGGEVGVFPVSEKSWQDIGDWSEYLKLIQK